MKTLKVLSALLTYPTAELQAARDELVAVIEHEAVLPKADRNALIHLIHDLAGGDLMDCQERFILLFDRTRALSLRPDGQTRHRVMSASGGVITSTFQGA